MDRELLPANKYDTKRAAKIALLEYEDVKDCVDDLLWWLQDTNWPVCDPLAPIFVKIGPYIDKEIITIFNSGDMLWAYNVMEVILLEQEAINLAIAELLREYRQYLSAEDQEDCDKILAKPLRV